MTRRNPGIQCHPFPRKWLVFFMLFLMGIVAGAANAMPVHTTEQTEVRLFYGGEIERGGATMPVLGLHFQMIPKWKTYWRHPGDAGAPIELDFAGSENIAGYDVLWPAPTRYIEAWGLETFGYAEEVVFPIVLARDDPGRPTDVQLHLEYTVCADICIPYNTTFTLPLPADAGQVDAADRTMINYWMRNTAVSDSDEVSLLSTTVDGTSLALTFQAHGTTRFDIPDAFIEGPEGVRFPKPQTTLKDGGERATLTYMAESAFAGFSLIGTPLTVTLTDTTLTSPVEIQTLAGAGPVVEASVTLPLILLFAFIGGLILNVMPCVLPVLSIKVIGVLEHSASARGTIRRDFLATAAGIVVSFLALATGVILLKQAGVSVGWGFHFQEPNFLIALALIITLFAANMWGFFEIRLPAFLSGAMEGTGGAKDTSLVSHFTTGMFATLLATPCSAPYLGTAVGFALASDAGMILLVFTCMGLGLAAPYLLVALAPGTVRLLPKPGAWMVRVKHVMGLFLMTTALWLVWVLSAQIGAFSAWVVLGLCLLMLVKLWYVKDHPRWGNARAMTTIIFVLAAAAFLLPDQLQMPHTAAATEDALWEPFDEERIHALVDEGNVVFVDVTADWCITCKFNKIRVLDTDAVRSALAAEDVVAMRADWTNRSPVIANYLATHRRSAIPFNAVYGPTIPDGQPLSELLSTEEVLEALGTAR